MTPSPESLETDPDLYWEHCRLPARVLERAGAEVGRQVRLRRGWECALFTAVDTAERAVVAPEAAGMLDGVGRLRVAAAAPTPLSSLAAGQLREQVGAGGPLVAIAPHGGQMEPKTDVQARRLGERGAAVWACLGWWPEGSAFDRWHVTSRDIHPGSFPALDGLLGPGSGRRGGFDAAVSFHGWRHDGVGVGGGASRTVRQRIAAAIERVVPPDVPVERIDEGAYVGDAPDNIGNWLTADGESGVQIEQSGRVRWHHGAAVADAVADALL